MSLLSLRWWNPIQIKIYCFRDYDSFSAIFSALFINSFMFKCWSQTICSFGSSVQSKQKIINKIAGSEKNLWLCSESIKWKSTSGSLKTQSHLHTKKRKNEINFPRVSCVALLCSTLSAKSCSYSHPVIILLCARCSYWLCSVSMNHCEWHKGEVEWRRTLDACYCGIWAQVQHQHF